MSPTMLLKGKLEEAGEDDYIWKLATSIAQDCMVV